VLIPASHTPVILCPSSSDWLAKAQTSEILTLQDIKTVLESPVPFGGTKINGIDK